MIVETISFSPGRTIPNNSVLPVLAYRQVFDRQDDLAAAFAARFQGNDWQGIWRNGVFDHHHYHSQAHEVLGIAGGEAVLMLGGPEGKAFTVAANDCLVLPAGTGHCRLKASSDFLVIGGYPPGQAADMQSGPADAAMLAAIRTCPLPERGPLDDAVESLRRHWCDAAARARSENPLER